MVEVPFFARETTPDDADARLWDVRLEMFMRCFEAAARNCGVRVNDGVSVKDYADAVVRAAKGTKLDPQLYELAWFVRKTAHAERPIGDLN